MYPTLITLALAILYLDFAVLVHAGLFVFQPASGSTCRAGQPCVISWVDDGARPLLSAVGVATVGLYTGKQQLVQTIAPVDVTKSHSVTFTPNAAAGPNSNSYYIALTSVGLKGNNSVPYSGWSPSFTLTGMSGSFDTPLPAATSPILIPASLTKTSTTASGTRTVTVGVLSTAVVSPLVSSPSSSSPSSSASASAKSTTVPSSSSTVSRTSTSSGGFTTVISSSSSSSSLSSTTPASSSSSTSSPSTSSSLGGASRLPPALVVFTTALLSALVFAL